MKDCILKIENICHSYEEDVLKDISLEVKRGEFITLLGASGCGKTTLIKIIAGLLEPKSGKIYIEGEDVTNVQPNKRAVNTIFQSYALFPHMNVYDNIAYGLKIKGYDKKTIKLKVEAVLDTVDMVGSERKKISKLSGGQKQRVAIARAIVNEPKILLLDEPLGALDLKLKRVLQEELKRLQRKLGITFIYITHDQEEAINLSDRIVVMKDGRFEQVGTPKEIYYEPKTSYVAHFIFETNVLLGKVTSVGNDIDVLVNNISFKIRNREYNVTVGDEVEIAFRGECLKLSEESKEGLYMGTVMEIKYMGGLSRLYIKLSDGIIIHANYNGVMTDYKEGDNVFVGFEDANAVILDV